MAVELTLPKFGLTMHDGTLQRYFKAPGETVNAGDSLYEVETEKVLYEVEAPASGTLVLWLHEEGATVECGDLVGVIAEAGDDVADVAHRYASDGNASHAAAPAESAATVAVIAGSVAGAGRRAVSPVARKRAAELGVDLERVAGTGPGGRVTREDVEHAAGDGGARGAVSGAAATVSASARGQTTAEDATAAATTALARVPLRGMRKTIAARMQQSLHDSAQLTISTEADVTAAVEFRARAGRDVDFTYTDMLVHAAARALRRHPRMNSRLADDAIATRTEVNVGMAVALDEGLIVPVIRGADRMSLREISSATKDLGERARSGHLKLEDVSDGTFTITNLGTWGVDVFTPILNPGETGILGVGRIVEKPAIYHGEIVRRWMLALSLTFDHRVIDGAPAAAFLQTAIEIFNYGER